MKASAAGTYCRSKGSSISRKICRDDMPSWAVSRQVSAGTVLQAGNSSRIASGRLKKTCAIRISADGP